MRRALVHAAAAALLFSAASAWARTVGSSDDRHLFGGAGFLFQNVGGRVASAANGTTSILGSFYPNFVVSGRWNFSDWLLLPSLGASLFDMPDPDSGTNKQLILFAVQAGRRFGSFDVHLGPGNMFYTLYGLGG